MNNSETLNIVDVSYKGDGSSTKTDKYGMREMQRRAFEKRESKHLLIKAPPASGKSRALMFLALDKLMNQGKKKVIIAVPERSIGASFKDTNLSDYGFFADWRVESRNDLTNDDDLTDKSKVLAFIRFMDSSDSVLLCTHATLRYAFEEIAVNKFNDCVLAIDEFHHSSTADNSKLGELLRSVMNKSNVQIIAMTGSYFRGDAVPILTPEDEAEFDKVTYTYYEQLNGYTYLKTLGIGYHFYTGSYLDHRALDAVLDTNKKTIVHIPNVNSKESTQIGKIEEVQRIYDIIGEWQKKDENNVDIILTKDGRRLRVANLVDDDRNHRDKLAKYLSDEARENIDAIDIIVALGMAKEGFDWPYCEHALTIGYRNSLTEIVQIIGRATRDSYNKTHAQFTNLIVQPNGVDSEIVVGVNSMLKAITASLLMEQVLAPSFKFTPKKPDGQKLPTGTIVINGLKGLPTKRSVQIVESDLEDLTAVVLQNSQVQKLSAKGVTGGPVKSQYSKIIRERHPDLSDEEVEAIRQQLSANIAMKTAEIKKDDNGDDRFIKISNRFVEINELDINLIDSINPFHHAFEVISKKIGSDTFKSIQDVITGSRIDMKVPEALAAVTQLKAFISAYGRYPSLHVEDSNEKYLAQVQAFLTAQRVKYENEKRQKELEK